MGFVACTHPVALPAPFNLSFSPSDISDAEQRNSQRDSLMRHRSAHVSYWDRTFPHDFEHWRVRRLESGVLGRGAFFGGGRGGFSSQGEDKIGVWDMVLKR